MSTGRAIDHIGIAAHSLDALAAEYEALGFTLTPQAHHPEHMGTTNRLVQFGGPEGGRNFLELIEVDRPGGITPLGDGVMSFGAYTQDFLARREGINLIVFRTDDRDADLARWADAGLDTYAPFNFERLATLPDGSQQTVRFELGFVTHPRIDVLFFVCHNRAEEHFWKPAFQAHANGAEEIEAVVLAADDPAQHAPFLASLFDGDIVPVPCGIVIRCYAHRIELSTPETLAERGWRGVAPPEGVAQPAGVIIRAPGRQGLFTSETEAGQSFIQWI